ncbi:MAG: hypothetical protein ACLT98_11670 [Eggerthellaceae bacterium]
MEIRDAFGFTNRSRSYSRSAGRRADHQDAVGLVNEAYPTRYGWKMGSLAITEEAAN